MVGSAAGERPQRSPGRPRTLTNEDGYVSTSRRGLLAVGLTVAVVGTIGVVSTVNAAAEEAPAGVATAADPGQPPPLLPWGAKPHPIKVGVRGADSRELAAAGASAANDDLTGQVTSFGSKGRAQPPMPPSAAKRAEGPYYLYAKGEQTGTLDGAAALMTIARPTVAETDWHSLAEIALRSADLKQVVEVGWTVDRFTNRDEETHLFVYHWVDGKETCYNGCGFVPLAGASIAPGATLAVDVLKPFGIQHSGTAWWIAYDSEWIGSFPDDLWKGVYVQAGQVQVYGEVTAATATPCTQMGNGKLPVDTAAAQINSVSFVQGPAVALAVSTTASRYPVVASASGRTFRYGGPTAC